jgi:hypothetical protein
MSRRGRRVPEAAPLLGVVLAFGVGGFGLLFGPPGSRLAIVALALALLYGFTAYGIVRSRATPDATPAIPPDAALAGGALVAASVAVAGVVVGQPMVGLLVAVEAVAPPAAYHARYGERRNPLTPNRTFGVAVAAALLVAIAGVVLEAPALGAVNGGVVLLAAADYRDARGDPLPALAEYALVAATLGGSALAVLYFGVVADRGTVGLLAGAALLAVGAYLALGRERSNVR